MLDLLNIIHIYLLRHLPLLHVVPCPLLLHLVFCKRSTDLMLCVALQQICCVLIETNS
jgi:hypothetical protein